MQVRTNELQSMNSTISDLTKSKRRVVNDIQVDREVDSLSVSNEAVKLAASEKPADKDEK